jgi:MoxR-like ATPase
MSDQKKILSELAADIQALRTELAKVIVGQEEVVEKLVVSLLSGGHCLLVGVPGLAKTLLIQSLASALGTDFKRIQFTPDLMPSDITGSEVLDVADDGKRHFKFIKGPVFTNILLADEINRTPPKTQAALLEAMQEKQVTIAGANYKLDEPFFVLATQNPLEQEGTYPLPEAQLDRFMFLLKLDYPSYEDEVAIVKRTTIKQSEKLTNLKLKNKLHTYQHFIKELPVADNVVEYAVKLVQQTRLKDGHALAKHIRYGAGPRASQYLVVGAKALAASRGEFLAEQHHVNEIAHAVLSHRVMLSFSGEAEGWTVEKIIDELKNEMQ